MPTRRRFASLIVPCRNQLRYTQECLASVKRFTSGRYELIVVDNGSTDGTDAYLRKLSSAGAIRVIRHRKNLGFGAAINAGMKAAEGDYLVWLNNDAVVTPGWLDRLVDCAERHPRAGAVGPIVNDESGRRSDDAPENAPKIAAALSLKSSGQARPAPWLIGFCLLVKRAAFEQVGLLDRRFGAGLFEDYDYCLRLRQAGYDILIAEDAYVHHHWHKSFAPGRFDGAFKKNKDVFIEKWCRQTIQFILGLPPLQYRRPALWTAPKGVN